ncbi:MAG: hypothetical protein ACXWWP_07765, partial [Candidatus Binatia bacterium]
ARIGSRIAAAHTPKAHAKIVSSWCHRRHVKQICRKNKRSNLLPALLAAASNLAASAAPTYS